jgi:hypothetical protein
VWAVALLVLLAAPDIAGAGPKSDLVELANGDRITCEIRALDRGKLTVATDGLGTIAIEWDDVAHVSSAALFDIELVSGQRMFGSLARGHSGSVLVVTPASLEPRPLAEIVRISPLGDTFLRRLEGAVDAGFSFTQANVQTQWTLHSTVTYRGRRWLSQLDADSALTTREDADGQIRNTVSLQTQRFLRPRWSAAGFAHFQQNEELSLDLRSVLGLGIVKNVLQSNRTVLSVLGAAAFTRELYAGASGASVAEAVAGLRWEWFTFDDRSTNLGVGALSFHSLNTDARIRLELTTSVRRDLIGDLYWSLNLFDSYNSHPPSGRKSNDFGISAAVGWSY